MLTCIVSRGVGSVPLFCYGFLSFYAYVGSGREWGLQVRGLGVLLMCVIGVRCAVSLPRWDPHGFLCYFGVWGALLGLGLPVLLCYVLFVSIVISSPFFPSGGQCVPW